MRCTSATSFDTLAVGVPSGMRQKSAVHDGGVLMSEMSSVAIFGWLTFLKGRSLSYEAWVD
jgi:hypothetical protein